MKHLNPLRTLRLWAGVSAIAAPAGILATVSCTASVAVAQSPNLPPLPPPLQSAMSEAPPNVGIPSAEATKNESTSDTANNAKALLVRARAALSEGRNDVATQVLGQAIVAAQGVPELANEVQQTRKQFADKSVPNLHIEQAVTAAQSSLMNSRAANALRNRNAQAAPASTLPMPNMTGVAMPPPGLLASAPSSTNPNNSLRNQAVGLATQAKMALDRGDVAGARKLVEQANSLRVPDSDYETGQLRPWNVALDIDRAERQRAGSQVMQASSNMPVASSPFGQASGVQNANAQAPMGTAAADVQPSVYQPKSDSSRVAPASGVLSSLEETDSGQELFDKGIKALSAGNSEAALKQFKAAWQKQSELDPSVRAQLKDKLMLLQSSSRGNGSDSVESATPEARENQIKRQRWFAEVTGEIADAERMASANKPMEALDKLKTLRLRVAQADVDGAQRKNLLAMVDRVTNHMQAWVDENKSTIELDQRNKQIEDRISQDELNRAKADAQVQTLVDQYNDLIDQGRYPEAEAVAKKVSSIKPNSEIANVLYNKAKIQRRVEEHEAVRALKQEKFIDVMNEVEIASTPYPDTNPLTMPSLRDWSEITRRRTAKSDTQMTPGEKKIRETLADQFSVSFDKRPLADAMNTVSEMTGIPIIIDDRSIAEEGITVDQPISLDLKGNSISLKSALNVMLERLNLTYTIKNEVLTIESARFNKKELRTETYNVKDLVIPIPNFVTDYNTGMAGALQSAYQATSNIVTAQVDGDSVAGAANRIASVDPNSSVLAQMNSLSGMGLGMNAMQSPGMLAGSRAGILPSSQVGLGGASMANYAELINLIQTTVTPDAWQAAGGSSNMMEFRQNLTLVVNAPQETHEKIAALLKSLRALQNLQVTIEVRFIQLEDTFFERIGIDFDFNINDKLNRLPRENPGNSVAVGLASVTGVNGPAFTNDLDLQVRNTFNVTPPAGRADASGTSVGLAILSDLELFFFLEAAQGNSRSNVLQAPKVTMFDGQFASINDFAQRPFVISYEPVVGDFAVAQRPIVVVLNEGTQMNVQSVVSQDKRFVRLTLVPQFTRIEAGDRQFTFQGRRSSSTGTSILNNGVPTNVRNNEEQFIEGTTVQQPTLGNTSVNTTVSVPDGGTILLGGIKRLREARTERGTPILSKIPYLNRLFKNNAIGRETNTLMMTVTPRIIIPEEEEEQLGLTPNRP